MKYEYCTTSTGAHWINLAVVEPDGDGWEMCGMAAGTRVFWTWKRAKSTGMDDLVSILAEYETELKRIKEVERIEQQRKDDIVDEVPWITEMAKT